LPGRDAGGSAGQGLAGISLAIPGQANKVN
jgi:hypothetical protein